MTNNEPKKQANDTRGVATGRKLYQSRHHHQTTGNSDDSTRNVQTGRELYRRRRGN